MNAPVSSKDHVVTYRGSTKSGHTWSCSCGSGSGDVAWADAFDRTMEAHAHLREISVHDSAEDAAEAMGNIAEGYALAIDAKTYGAVTTGKLSVGRDGGQVIADFAVVATF